MIQRHGWSLLPAMLVLTLAPTLAIAADVPALDPMLPPMDAKLAPPMADPVFIPGTACRDGNCTPRPLAKSWATPVRQDHPPIGYYADRLGKWFFYRAAPTPHECCGHLPDRCPPLTAWFPCKPGACQTAACAPANVYPEAIRVAPRPDLPPPLPPQPQMTMEERPLIPGSSTAMSNKQPAVKIPLPSVKPEDDTGAPKFKRTGINATGIVPIELRIIEPRWEKAK